MKYLSDLHTHTIVSGHAYNTLFENIDYCVEKGIKILGTSEHGPKMPGAPHRWYFGNLRVLPRVIKGVTILKGCEANILDSNGKLDMNEHDARSLDYMIASLHEPIFDISSPLEETTAAILNAIDNNPLVTIVGHLGNPVYKINYEAVVKKAKEKDIIIEINNSSMTGASRKGSDGNCKKIAQLCKEYGTKIMLNSDAHICFNIGAFDESIEMLKSIDFPEELIMNDPERLISFLKKKGRLKDIK